MQGRARAARVREERKKGVLEKLKRNHDAHRSAEERAAIVIQKRFRGMQERTRFKRRQEERKAEKRVRAPCCHLSKACACV